MARENIIDNIIDIKSKTEITVSLLLTQGVIVYCDESVIDAKKMNELPKWYDEEKFKRGQKFFHDNLFVMFFAKFCGLLTILVIPTILNILKFTNMSSTPLAAYRRYMSTLFHMILWYDKDFNPDSKSWQSIKTVRTLHFSASNRASNNKLNRISQADMVFTQFGFIGYIFTHPKLIGFYNATDEDLEGLTHLWRVVGYLLGIEDRFNLCSGTVKETKEYCNLLIQKVFTPRLREVNDDFKQMSFALIDGMTVFQPFLNYSVFMIYIHELCNVSLTENNNETFFTMTWYDKFVLNFTKFVIHTYQFYLLRLFYNVVQSLALYYFIKYVPFFAYKKFGFKDGHLSEHIRRIY